MSTEMAVVRAEPRLTLWRDPAFVVFWSARTFSCAGTGITLVVLPVLVYRLTHSPAETASLAAIEAIPYLAFGLFAGALADRVDRRKVMVVSDAAAGILLFSVPVAAALHLLTTAQLFLVALGVAIAFVWFDAANFGALPSLVDRSQLPKAASMVWSSGSVAMLLAPTLGAGLIVVMAPPYILSLDAASYFTSALLLTFIRRPFQPPDRPNGDRRIRADIADGLRFLWHQPVIRTMTLSVFTICVTWGGTFGLLVVYAGRALHLVHADVRLGLLYTAGELGGLIACLLVPRIVKRPAVGRVAAAFMAGNAVILVLLAVTPGYGWALLLFFCFEFTYTMMLAVSITIRQMLTPDHLQGRVNTTGRLIAWGGQPVGALLGGLLAELMPVRLVFGLMTIAVAAGAGLAGWSCRRGGPLHTISLPGM